MVSQFMTNSRHHLVTTKKTIRYILGTPNTRFAFSSEHTSHIDCLFKWRLGVASRHLSIHYRMVCIFRRSFNLLEIQEIGIRFPNLLWNLNIVSCL